MKAKRELIDLLSLLKVFDTNYVSENDCIRLHGLNVNDTADVVIAVDTLLLPEFRTYNQNARSKLIELLRESLSDPSETFAPLFERIELAFDDDLKEPRTFMNALLIGLESARIV